MTGIKPSIYWKLLNSFLAVIICTSGLSAWTQYRMFRQRLPELLTRMYSESMARSIENLYNEAGGWEMIQQEALSHLAKGEAGSAYQEMSLRIILRDNRQKTIFNSFFMLKQPEDIPLTRGNSIPVFESRKGTQVGNVTVYISRNYLETEAGHYLVDMIGPGLIFLFVTILASTFIAALLTKWIGAPVTALTKATTGICTTGSYQLLPKTSNDELGQMTESFNNMIRVLHSQRSLRKRLTVDLAHEINTPLNLIRFEAKGILDGLISPREAARNIIEEIDKLRNLIHDLNWLAETDSGLYKLSKQKQDYTQLISEAIERWEIAARNRGISLHINPPSTKIPEIMIDKLRIQQVLDNLIENSIKNTHRRGAVTITCHESESDIITSVSDTGTGIAENDLPYIFERFYRADSSRARENGGQGLGLSISKRILKLHGGDIYAENNKEGGSCFTFTLPINS